MANDQNHDVMKTQGNGTFEWTDRHLVNLNAKQKFVEALFVNDYEEMAKWATPDFELREPARLPFGGTYAGMDGFKACWDKIPVVSHRTTAISTLHTYMTADPDHLWVELDCTMVQNCTGADISQVVMEKFEFRNGKISAIVLYWFDIPDWPK